MAFFVHPLLWQGNACFTAREGFDAVVGGPMDCDESEEALQQARFVFVVVWPFDMSINVCRLLLPPFNRCVSKCKLEHL
jgi:hypothetical protein